MKIEVLDVLLNTVDKVKKFTDGICRLKNDVDIIQGKYTVDAKSIMGVFSLNLVETVAVKFESDDEEDIDKFIRITEEFRQ